MNRRAKLSLAAVDETGQKEQPSDFDTTTDARPNGEPKRRRTRQKQAKPQSPGRARDEGLIERRTWPNARQVAKVVLVVTVSALSLYLLKRRFF